MDATPTLRIATLDDAAAILEACEAAALAEGFTTLALMATLPGVLLHEKFGFERVEDAEVTMPDGTTVAAVSMRMAVPRSAASRPSAM